MSSTQNTVCSSLLFRCSLPTNQPLLLLTRFSRRHQSSATPSSLPLPPFLKARSFLLPPKKIPPERKRKKATACWGPPLSPHQVLLPPPRPRRPPPPAPPPPLPFALQNPISNPPISPLFPCSRTSAVHAPLSPQPTHPMRKSVEPHSKSLLALCFCTPDPPAPSFARRRQRPRTTGGATPCVCVESNAGQAQTIFDRRFSPAGAWKGLAHTLYFAKSHGWLGTQGFTPHNFRTK